MKTTAAVLALIASFGLQTSATAQAAAQSRPEVQDPQPVQPDQPAPDQPPPPPPSRRPDPPAAQPEAPREAPQGQWVYTDQYGWVWMPHGDDYTHVPRDGGTPLMYVYYPASGWCWLVAPWIWGWGPMPYFGVLGYARFGWWGWGFGHWYGFSGRYAHWGRGGWGYHDGGRWHYNGPHSAGSFGRQGPHSSGPSGFRGPHSFAPGGARMGSGSPRGFSSGAHSGSPGSHRFSGHFGRR